MILYVNLIDSGNLFKEDFRKCIVAPCHRIGSRVGPIWQQCKSKLNRASCLPIGLQIKNIVHTVLSSKHISMSMLHIPLIKKHHFHYWATEWYSHDFLCIWLDFLFGQNCSSIDFSVIGWDVSFGILLSGYVISFWNSWCWNIVSKSISITVESLVFASSIFFV